MAKVGQHASFNFFSSLVSPQKPKGAVHSGASLCASFDVTNKVEVHN
jgi:hypothetical protein